MATAFELAVARRVRDARVRAGWTQEQLAEKAAIEPATLSRYERGGSSIPLDVLRRMALVLGTGLARLVDVDGELPKRLSKAPEVKRVPRRSEEAQLLAVWRLLKPRDRKLIVTMCQGMAGIKRGLHKAETGASRARR